MYGSIRPLRPCASCTVATPRRSSVAIVPASARWMLRTTVPLISARSGDAAGLQELLERLAAERRHHLWVRHALRARQLLQAEEARAVVLQRLPVEPAQHVLLLVGQVLHGLLGILQEGTALLALGQVVQEAIQAEPPAAPLQVEDVRHSNSATAIAVVMGR